MVHTRRSGHICTVCGENDLYTDKRHPHEYFCEHCYNILDDWFDELKSDMKVSAKALKDAEITDDDVINALQMYLYERSE